jgi:hypothetical protein
MFLLSVKMTSCSILEMQRCKWPETLSIICELQAYLTALTFSTVKYILKK